jgi:hypothetical protein
MDEGLIQAGSSPESRGNAGGIEVRVGRLALTRGAEISTSTFVRGRSGRSGCRGSSGATMAIQRL